jgi:hypothetical protein
VTSGGRTGTALAGASVLATVTPIVVAVVRGIRRGWLPIGDNAFFEVRARDVLTAHHPLVGTWTSASLTVGKNINNPGPLFFDLLALPTKVGGPSGLAVGVAAVNVLCVAAIAAIAWRHGGAVATTAAMACTATLLWSMGSELLYDPWQPNALLLPFLLLLTLVWATVLGDRWMLPAVVAVASLIVQTHFSYAVLIAVLALVTAVGAAVSWRRGTRFAPPALAAVVVAALCWVQPLIDQFDDDGHGNLTNLLGSAGAASAKVGAALGTRIVASIVALPPFWGRPSIADGVTGVLPSPAAAAVALVATAVVLAAVAGLAVRRRDGAAGAALGLSAVLLVAALATAAIIPVGVYALAAHQFRWLWPLAAFATFAVLLTLGQAAAGRVGAVAVAGVLTVAALIATGLDLPTYNAATGPTADADAIPTARRLLAQLGPIEGRGPVLLDIRGLRFAEPYNLAVMAELQRRGIEFHVDDDGMVHQLGTARAADGSERARILQRDRDDVLAPPPDESELVARVVGLTPAERAERDRLADEVAGYVEAHGLRLNAEGRRLRARGELADFGPARRVLHVPRPFIAGDTIVRLVREDLVTIDPAWRARIDRYVDLLERWNRHTVAIYLEPLP